MERRAKSAALRAARTVLFERIVTGIAQASHGL
jgi:hypothetical protein